LTWPPNRRPGSGRAYTFCVSTDLLEEARKLSPRDRLELIAALWDTLSDEDVPVTAEDRALLDARMADLEANPGSQSPWPEVKARLEQRRR
jgi:putative addiction module component (TIGR02574 family)